MERRNQNEKEETKLVPRAECPTSLRLYTLTDWGPHGGLSVSDDRYAQDLQGF